MWNGLNNNRFFVFFSFRSCFYLRLCSVSFSLRPRFRGFYLCKLYITCITVKVNSRTHSITYIYITTIEKQYIFNLSQHSYCRYVEVICVIVIIKTASAQKTSSPLSPGLSYVLLIEDIALAVDIVQYQLQRIIRGINPCYIHTCQSTVRVS